MSTIERIEILQVDLAPKVVRTDAIQSFVTQETPIVRITCSDGAQGIGYTYTIGTGGSSVVALLRDHLAPKLIGRDPSEIDAIWKDDPAWRYNVIFLRHSIDSARVLDDLAHSDAFVPLAIGDNDRIRHRATSSSTAPRKAARTSRERPARHTGHAHSIAGGHSAAFPAPIDNLRTSDSR